MLYAILCYHDEDTVGSWTKEQLLGFYIVDCKNLDEALDVARDLGAANPGGAYEIRPVGVLNPGSVPT